MEAILYKGFFIVVRVHPERTTENKFQVIDQIYRNLAETPIMRNWLGVHEFASEKAGSYEFGLREASVWIEEERARLTQGRVLCRGRMDYVEDSDIKNVRPINSGDAAEA